jgi:hypothetical protein
MKKHLFLLLLLVNAIFVFSQEKPTKIRANHEGYFYYFVPNDDDFDQTYQVGYDAKEKSYYIAQYRFAAQMWTYYPDKGYYVFAYSPGTDWENFDTLKTAPKEYKKYFDYYIPLLDEYRKRPEYNKVLDKEFIYFYFPED